jgi:hypothetical protein
LEKIEEKNQLKERGKKKKNRFNPITRQTYDPNHEIEIIPLKRKKKGNEGKSSINSMLKSEI